MTEAAPTPAAVPADGKAKGRGCKGCLVAALVIAGIPILLLAAYIAWGLWANERSQRLASEFCAQVRVGEPLAQLLARADAASPGNRFQSDDGYRFIWYGMVFHASECRVKLAGGRVTGKELQHFDD